MRRKTGWILLALPTVVAGLILIILLNWHIPTRVKIVLETDRVFFKVGGEGKSTILDSLDLRSVIVEKFDSVKLRPESLTPLARGGDSRDPSSRSGVASRALTITQQPVVITGKEGRSQPNVALAGIEDGKRTLLSMDSVIAGPASEVTLESTDDLDLMIRVDGQQSSGKITVVEPIKLTIDQCEIAGISKLNLEEPLTLKARLLRDSSIEFNGRRDSLILTVTVPPEKATSLVPQGGIPVTAIKFERLDGSGKVLSSLRKNSSCKITYLDYKIDEVTVNNPDFISVDELQSFSIKEITYLPEQNGISMTLEGIADKVKSGSSDYSKDHRLTVYNALWNNYKVVALFAVLCWVAGTTAGFYKFSKEK